MGLNVVAASKPAVPEIPPELESSGKATLAIGGMWCTSCAKAVEAMFAKQPGVKQASVSFASETARVHWDTGRTVLSRIIEPVLKLGYGISPVTRADAQYQNIKREVDDLKKRLVWAAGGAGWTMLVSLVDHWPGRMTALEPEVRTGVFLSAGAACILVIFYSGLPFLRAGMRTLKAGVPGMDFLISAGALSAAALSFWNLFRGAGHLYFDAAAMLIAFLLGGRIIEHAARRKSRSTLQTLLAEAPARASVLTGDGKEARRAVEEIRCGERIRIRPGERISLDGIVRQGESAVDNSLITGESRPVDVGPGIRVLAGAINTDGELIVEVEQEKGERRIDHISRKMGEILAEKAPYETLSAELAQKLVPVVFGVSLLSAVWAIFGGSTTEEAIVRAVSVLVITCPCALGLATPMALMVALGEGAKFGLVFRDGETIEKLALVNEIYFDKTGTLTEGKPAVAALLPAQGVSEEELLEAAALAESGSEHPIAHAVLKRWGKERVNQGTVRAFAGKGVEWSGQNGDIILAGSAAFLQEKGAAPSGGVNLQATAVYTAKNGRYLGALVLDDALRADAAWTLRELHAMGLELAMLTGDGEYPAKETAKAAGLPEEKVFWGVSPEEKAQRIVAVLKRGAKAAFVGEGLNDGPALSAATVGIAVQGACDLALASGAVVLQQGGISSVLRALRIARRTRQVMKENLFFAVGYNLLAVPLAAAGYVEPMIAAGAMVLSSLSVTANSLRIRLQREK